MSDQQNSVFINPDGFIEARLVGPQTDAGFRYVFDQAEPLIEQFKKDGKPLLGLLDMTGETSYSLSSNKAALELLERLEYDKLALCSAPHKEVTKGIILALGKSDQTKVFDDRAQAVAWLLN